MEGQPGDLRLPGPRETCRWTRITTAHVLAVLSLPYGTEKRVTARRLRSRISYVMRWCVGRGYREGDPAGDTVTAALA